MVKGTWVLEEGEKASGEKASYLESCYPAHFGPITAVQRSPFFEDCILTVGDWTFSLFMAQAEQVCVCVCGYVSGHLDIASLHLFHLHASPSGVSVYVCIMCVCVFSYLCLYLWLRLCVCEY